MSTASPAIPRVFAVPQHHSCQVYCVIEELTGFLDSRRNTLCAPSPEMAVDTDGDEANPYRLARSHRRQSDSTCSAPRKWIEPI
jgi:hypothetical protein